MSLYFDLRIQHQIIGSMEIQRVEDLDLIDKEAIADAVSTYKVRVNDKMVGTVHHRYGDGAWVLLGKAVELYVSMDRSAV
jgi:hypothetical protein